MIRKPKAAVKMGNEVKVMNSVLILYRFDKKNIFTKKVFSHYSLHKFNWLKIILAGEIEFHQLNEIA